MADKNPDDGVSASQVRMPESSNGVMFPHSGYGIASFALNLSLIIVLFSFDLRYLMGLWGPFVSLVLEIIALVWLFKGFRQPYRKKLFVYLAAALSVLLFLNLLVSVLVAWAFG